jgi:hypothetical protein
MMYSCSAVRVKRGRGGIAGSVDGCASYLTADEHSMINITNAPTCPVIEFHEGP